jgi:hypothetical protein
MNLKRSFLLGPALLSLASAANGQNFTGQIGIQEDPAQTGSYTTSSLQLDATNITDPAGATGTFLATVPPGTSVTAYALDITGLSTAPKSVSINDFLQIGSAGQFGSTGTTPTERFDFNLQTLEESSDGQFIGVGTLVDTDNQYANTTADLYLSFSSLSNYSFTLGAVPEPGTIAIALTGLAMFPLFRRKIS